MEGLLDLWNDEFKELLQRNLTKWAEIPEGFYQKLELLN